MRALCCKQFGPPDSLEWVEIDAPTPKPDEVAVEVRAAGVGFVDGLMVQGKYQIRPTLPYYPGSEFAGVITQVGSNIDTSRIGERVMGLASSGAYAETVTAPANGVVALPPDLDDLTAAGFFINYATALYGLRDCGNLQPGETVLILGAAGGVGSAAIAVAKAMGARVIAAASTQVKRRAAQTYGADLTLDYSVGDWRSALKTMTADSTLNLVYDPVGGNYSEPAFRSLAPGGRFLVVGFAAGQIPSLPLNLALLKRASLVGVDWGGEMRANPKVNVSLMTTLMQWIQSGKLHPAPVTVRAFDDVRAALSDQLDGKIVGKLVLQH